MKEIKVTIKTSQDEEYDSDKTGVVHIKRERSFDGNVVYAIKYVENALAHAFEEEDVYSFSAVIEFTDL